jgi:hypothetical protein
VFAKAMLPYNAIIGQIIIYINFTLIRHWDQQTWDSLICLLLMSFSALFIWSFILETCGRVHGKGKAVLKSWHKLNNLCINTSDHGNIKYILKTAKSLKPLCVGCPGYFTIRPRTLMNFLRGIVRGTCRAIIVLK